MRAPPRDRTPLRNVQPNMEPALSGADLHAALPALGPIDLVVGINTRNVETTIVHVLNVVCMGLQDHFPDLKSLVVVCDGGSADQTVPMAQFYPAPHAVHKLVVHQKGGRGKGNGVRTIFEIADAVDAHACACVDGDLLSIDPTWIGSLLAPILYGLADMVVPYYLRDTWDGVITNHLCYPLTAALYGTSVRQPIGGDYSFSRRFIRHALDDERMPGDFGIDLYLTTTAIAEGFRIQEAPLGIKVHASSMGYVDPTHGLTRMYLEVVGTLLQLTARHEHVWRHAGLRPAVLLSETVVPYHGRLPPPVSVDEHALRAIYADGLRRQRKTLEALLPAAVARDVAAAGEQGLEAGTWARAVYAMVGFHVAQKRADVLRPPDDLLHTLGALGMGRFLRFVAETRALDLQEASERIKEQALVFVHRKGDLVTRVDALREKARHAVDTSSTDIPRQVDQARGVDR